MLKTRRDVIIGNVPCNTSPERLLRLKEVRALTGLGSSTLYRLIGQGRFPKQVHPLGNKLAAWRASEVHAWISERVGGQSA
jgi:prophage regulatory protein